MKDISDKILRSIKEKQIKPKAKWLFSLEKVLIWTAVVLVTLVGSLAVSALMHRVVTQDWDIHRFLGRNPLHHIMVSLPYLWIGLVCIFVWLAYYNVRRTKSGYKYKAYWIVIGSIVVSLVLGTVFYSTQAGKGFDALLSGKLPPFLMANQEKVWLNPDQGLLGGQVVEIQGEVLGVKDFEGQLWQVDIQGAQKPQHVEIKVGDKLKLVGQKGEGNTFDALGIRPWEKGPFGKDRGFDPQYPKVKGQMHERRPF
ncbi:MAG: hypothetical protein ABIB97_01730 [Patescibacteria group bacterium]